VVKISIALASYNGQKYILEQLESFSCQSRRPDEVIISDDCSTDETVSLIRKFSLSAPFVVKLYVNKINLGYAQNFANALSKTTGDLIFLSDQDDVWFPNKINDVYKIAISSEALLIMNDAEITDRNLNPSGLSKLNQIKAMGFNSNKFVMGCCAAIKRDLLDLTLPMDSSFPAHDTWISWFAEFMGLKVVCSEIMQYYRRHDSNESQYSANKFVEDSTLTKLWTRIRLAAKDTGEDLCASEMACRSFDAFINSLVNDRVANTFEAELIGAQRLSAEQLKRVRERITLRKLWFPARTYRATLFLLSGHYQRFSGIKSYARDIFFK
jgi:glycosyltransferase involved in cell wall biosynthesis